MLQNSYVRADANILAKCHVMQCPTNASCSPSTSIFTWSATHFLITDTVYYLPLDHTTLNLIHTTNHIPMISIPTKRPLSSLRPPLFLIQPITTKELTYTGIIWFLLRRLKWYEPIEIFVHGCRVAGAAVGRLWRTVSVEVHG